MVFFGAESGSDWVLEQMNKGITADQTLELAAKIRRFGIVPEFSFVVGNPQAPERDTRDTIRFIRRIKKINPDAEIIVQHYIPTPHPDGMYGEIDGKMGPRTQAALRDYQQKQGLKATGQLDAETSAKLGVESKTSAAPSISSPAASPSTSAPSSSDSGAKSDTKASTGVKSDTKTDTSAKPSTDTKQPK